MFGRLYLVVPSVVWRLLPLSGAVTLKPVFEMRLHYQDSGRAREL